VRKTLINLLIILSVLFAVTLTGILLYIADANNDFSDKMVIRSNGITEKVFEVTDLSLIPTESKDYEIELVSVLECEFIITLDYIQTTDGGLGEFVDVIIKVSDEVYYEGKLDDLFNTDSVLLKLYFESSETKTILITYKMDESVGNEAKGTFSDFEIKLIAKRNVGE
jgi:hypothetical protein